MMQRLSSWAAGDARTRFVFIGRLDHYKGMRTLLDALVVRGAGDVAQADPQPRELRIRAVPGRPVELVEHLVGGSAVAVADQLARDVQDRLQGELRGLGRQRPGCVEHVVLTPAQVSGEVRRAAGAQRQVGEGVLVHRRHRPPRELGSQLPGFHGRAGVGHPDQAAGQRAGQPQVDPLPGVALSEQDVGVDLGARVRQDCGQGGGVGSLVAVGVQADLAVRGQGDDQAGVVGDPAQRHERAHLAGDRAPVRAVALEGDRPRDATTDAQRDDQAAIGGELVEPGGRDVARADGGDDPGSP